MSTFTPDWLALRESADAAARAPELLDYLPPAEQPLVIRDLGCGTGSLTRWLAGRLPLPQHWILHDRDPELLARALDSVGNAVTAEAQEGDLTSLRAEDLVGTSLVTASALLDLLTFEEVDGLAAACVEAGCPALLTLSVEGKVELAPADPLDAELTEAFNAHQRRSTGGRRLLGPDAVPVAVEAFQRRGARVRTRPSPWRLGADDAALAKEWLHGWVSAACEQRPDLTPQAEDYLCRRLADELAVVVHHIDLIAIPS